MSDLLPQLGWVGQAIVVVLAFSVLIFVHELGHYLAARVTGVRVERFFIGFDVFGLAVKKEYKGTVYGIGILPLGGYCALAGQNDDPRKERQTSAPDELQNKSIPARMLVFGGGVLMNFAFGFLVLIAAYMYGIPFIPPVLGVLDPNGPAAVHGFRTGDRILKVDGAAVSSFEDATEAIALAGAGSAMDVEIERVEADGSARAMTIHVKGRAADGRGNLNTIGADPERSRIVAGVVEDPIFSGRLAAGDEILAVNGEAIPANRGERIQELLARRPGEEVALTVKHADGATRDIQVPLETYGEWDLGLRPSIAIGNVSPDGVAAKAGLRSGDLVVAYRTSGADAPERFTSTQEFVKLVADAALRPIAVTVRGAADSASAASKTKTETVTPALAPAVAGVSAADDTLLGVLGEMEGEDGFRVAEVLPGSPLGDSVRAGDFITALNGSPLPRGRTLRAAVEDAAADTLRLFVRRQAGEDEILPFRTDVPDANLSLRMSPRINPEYRRPMIGVDLAAGPVTAVVPGSFADTQLGGEKRLAGSRLALLQYSPDLSTTTFRFVFPADSPYGGGLKTFVAETPEVIRDAPLAAGLLSRLPVSLKVAEEVLPLPFFPAVAAAGKKWVDLSLMVYSVLHKLVVRTLPIDAVGGPVQLFRIIKIADERGVAYFLYIVALISVNLGVCNLLPFPVLDGGHIVFLLIEWLMGRPPSPRVKETAQWIGLVCLLLFMMTVTGYDLMHLVKGTG